MDVRVGTVKKAERQRIDAFELWCWRRLLRVPWTARRSNQYIIVIHTVKGFAIVSKAEIEVFLELYCFFYDPVDVGNLVSCSSAFSKTSLNIWKFTVHILLKPGLENFEH